MSQEAAGSDAGALGWLSPGLRYMALSAFFFSLMSVLVKWAGASMPSQQIVLARAAIALVLSWVAIKRLGISPWGERRRGLLVMRGLFGFGALSCFFWAITHLPLADATVIQYVNPILVALLAALFLGESVGPVEIGGVGVSLAGVVMIGQPSFLFGGQAARLDPLAVGVALLGAFLSACAYTTIRAVHGQEDPMVVVFYFPLIATPLALPVAWPVLEWPGPLGWLLLLGVGVFTQIAQIFMTRGLHMERAGRATSISYLQIVFAFAWGVILFGERPSALAVLGAALVVGSSIVVARSRHQGGEPERADSEPA